MKRPALAGLEAEHWAVLSEDVFARAVATASPQGIAALFERDWKAVGAAARAKAVAQFGWDATFTGLTGLYGQLTGRPSAQIVELAPGARAH